MQWPIIPIKNLTSLFPLIFLSQHISLHALGRLKWVLEIIWPLNQHFNLKNQRNWIKLVLMLRFLIGIICILLHRPKKITLVNPLPFISIMLCWVCSVAFVVLFATKQLDMCTWSNNFPVFVDEFPAFYKIMMVVPVSARKK